MVNLCQHNGLSCFGCCGHSYLEKKDIKKDIRKNSRELAAFLKEGKSLKEFRNRYRSWDLGKSGICRNLVEKKGEIFCPLHKAKNKGVDLRKGHCDINHLCRPFRTYLKWSEEKQERFVKFILKKKEEGMDNYDYSMLMDSAKMLREFEKLDV